jgi:hypothetical protein
VLLDPPVPRAVYRPAELRSLAQGKPVGDGSLRAVVPGTLTITPRPDDPEPLDVVVVMELDVIDRRLACVGMKLRTKDDRPAPLTAEMLRRIPIGRYLQMAVATGLTVLEVSPDGGSAYPFVPPPPDFAAAGMTDAVLREVARLYNWALATGDAPLGLLERHYGIPRGRASRWIATARRRGYIKDTADAG